MNTQPCIRRRSARPEQGFALLTVVFLSALLTIAAASVSLNVLTEGRREKEREMIWRGNQYVRAIKLYYRKNGRFPAQLDDLYKAKQGSVRFLRQPYKDPMNKEDGSWRLIYVGQAGQLIGSLKPRTNLQLPVAGSPAAPGTATGTAGASGSNAPATQGGATGTGGAAGGTPAAPGGTPGQGGTPGDAQGGDASGLPAGNVDSPTVFGGRIIGIGSKIDRRSIIVYDKAKNYRLYEFIWDPSKDTGGSSQPAIATPSGQPGVGPLGQPLPAQPGQPPANPNPNPGGNPPQPN
jgi:hypothetical protein